MKKILKGLDQHFEEYLLVALLGAMAIIMLLQVIMRYVFRMPLQWPEEVCRYIYIWCCFLGISYCIAKGIELKVDLFERLFKGTAKKVIQVILQLMNMALYAYLCVSSFSLVEHVIKTSQTSSAARIPMVLVYVVIPLGTGLAALRCIQNVYSIVSSADSASGKE